MLHSPAPRHLLALALLCAIASAALVLGDLDRSAFLAINGAAAHWLPAPLPSSLTILGHGLVAVMLLAPFLERAPQVLAAGLYAAPVAGLFSWVGKRLAAVPRPGAALDLAQIHVQGPLLSGHNSFPSGHAITAFLVVSVIALGAERLPARTLTLAAVLLLGTLVAASRVMVGAHWPSDALAGAALGTLAGVAGHAAAGRWPLWRRPQAVRVLALIVLCCAVSLAAADTGYRLAQPLQWALAALGALLALMALLRGRAARGDAAR